MVPASMGCTATVVVSKNSESTLVHYTCLLSLPTTVHGAACMPASPSPFVPCRSQKEFRRVILRYSATGEALSLTEEVYRPVAQ